VGAREGAVVHVDEVNVGPPRGVGGSLSKPHWHVRPASTCIMLIDRAALYERPQIGAHLARETWSPGDAHSENVRVCKLEHSRMMRLCEI